MPIDQLTNEQIDNLKEEDLKDTEMTFLEHLEALRWHLIRAVAAVGVFTTVAFVFAGFIFKHIIFAPTRADFWTYRQLCYLGKLWDAKSLCIEKLNFQSKVQHSQGNL